MAFKCAGKCLKISSDILRRHLNSPLSHYPRLYLSDAVSFTARTNTCGSLRHCDVGKPVRLCGWIQYQRMGGKFLIIRDWQGLTQLFIPENKKSLASQISSLTYETVVEVTGTVRPRPDGQENKQMDTGDIEVEVEELQVLNMATPDLPFQIKDQNVNEALRMECRYLDIRTKQMQRNLRLRSKMIMKMREFLTNKHEFVDVETPTLFRRTPGGAKEFVVPSRQKGKFYSLPQSPQQFKQLLMVGGIDRYFQIARCYRDEGAKPDRQPEFTQLDLEMSFVDREGVIGLMEQMMAYCWPEHKPALETPFPRLTYEQAMRLYGVDKPDTRFDMKLYDVTTQLRNCGAQVLDERSCLEDGTIVAFKLCDRERNISNSELKQLRKEALDRLNDTKSALLPVRIDENGDWLSTISKHLTTQTQKAVTMELDLQPGDLVVIAAGQKYAPHECLGKLRLMVADHLENKGVAVRDKESYNFLWVVDFPMFLPKETDYGLESAHHPFTDVHPEDRHLLHTAPHQVRGQHYDLVLNGNEVGGGSIRIHNPEDQRYILETILKEDASELEHLLKAFTMGCPPHGGIALGLDRLFAVVCGATSIRDVIAFPKSADSKDLMSRAPAAITQSELDLYHIQVKQQEP